MALIQANQSVVNSLVSGVVTTVQFLNSANGIRVFNRDITAPIYCRIDGIDPAVGGDGSFLVPPAEARLFFGILPDGFNPEIRLVSSALTHSFVVEGVLVP